MQSQIHWNSLIQLLTKRHVKMVEQMRLAAEQENTAAGQQVGYVCAGLEEMSGRFNFM